MRKKKIETGNDWKERSKDGTVLGLKRLSPGKKQRVYVGTRLGGTSGWGAILICFLLSESTFVFLDKSLITNVRKKT